MAIIKCKMCGGDLRIEEGSTVCECEYCGTRQTVPSADNEKKLTLFSRAGRLLRGCEFDKAAGVFETIVADFPEEAEAYWGLVLCKYGIEYVDDPATGKKIPTCHRSSFESVLDDPNFEQACENTDAIARRVYRDEARQIEDLRKQIIEVSGKEEPYDIFISYKETDEHGDRTLDSVIAQDIYTELTEKGYRVFFSRISLEDKLGTEYEPYIFAALNSAKVMLVVGTDYENYDAVWVKNEWSRFLKLIASGQKKTLIPVFKNMDAYDMPKEFAKLAAQDMGKVGAMQDLVRGVEKLIGIKKTEPASQQPVYVSNEADAKTAAAVKRGFMALEDSEWSKAKEYFDQALTLDAECAEAYLGLALADEQCASEDTYISRRCAIRPEQETKSLSPNREREDAAVQNYALPHFLSENEIRELFKFDLSYSSGVKGMQKIAEQEKNSFRNNRNLARAFRFGKGETKSKLDAFQSGLFTKLDDGIEQAKKQEAAAREQKAKEYEVHLAAAEQKAAELRRAAEEKREAAYQSACKKQSEATTIREYQAVMDSFLEFQSYRDSNQHIDQCRAAIEDLKEKESQLKKAAADEAERQRLITEKVEKERLKKKKLRLGFMLSTVVVAIVAFLIYTKIVIPSGAYKAADNLFENGQYEEALKSFEELGNFRDSSIRVEEVREAIRSKEYNAAESLFEAGKFEEAITAFEQLNNYKDSRQKVREAQYAINSRDYSAAEELLKAQKYEEAIAAFSALDGFSDSETRVVEVANERDYVAAEALLANNDFGRAAIAFGNLGDYRDAHTRSLAVWEKTAKRGTIAQGDDFVVGVKTDGTTIIAKDLIIRKERDYNWNVREWRNIIAVAAGAYHAIGLKADGTVVATGDNSTGQCDVGDWKDVVAIDAGPDYTIGLKADGTVVAVGQFAWGQKNTINSWHDIIAIAAGKKHTVGLMSDGTVVTAGASDYGQNKVENWRDIIAIAAGSYQTVGLKANGTVVAVGETSNMSCNVGGWRDVIAITASDDNTLGLKKDGTVLAHGHGSFSELHVDDWRDIIYVKTSDYNTIGLKSNGTVMFTDFSTSFNAEVTGWKNIKIPNT